VTEDERREILEDEWLMVRHSGEIPEITFHATLYYLTEEKDGPGLNLRARELETLKEAALERYYEIILRDINMENYNKTIYRGVRRSLYNWHRCKAFAERQFVRCGDFREKAAQTLLLFLDQGIKAAGREIPEQFMNCSLNELEELVEELGLSPEQLPQNIAQFCLPD